MNWSCTACGWIGDTPSVTHEKVMDDESGLCHAQHRWLRVCPTCFDYVQPVTEAA